MLARVVVPLWLGDLEDRVGKVVQRRSAARVGVDRSLEVPLRSLEVQPPIGNESRPREAICLLLLSPARPPHPRSESQAARLHPHRRSPRQAAAPARSAIVREAPY